MVQTVELPNKCCDKKVGRDPAKKVVEGLKKIQINENDLERYFLVGETLPGHEEFELVQFLKEYIDVFAWTLEEMSGVDPDVICHHLNVDPRYKPVM